MHQVLYWWNSFRVVTGLWIVFSLQSFLGPLNTEMGIWKTFDCCQLMACNEGHGTGCISSFHGLAHKPAFVAASTRPSLACFLHSLHGCICNIPPSGSVSTEPSTCFINYHPCRTGMSRKHPATDLKESHRVCNFWGVGGGRGGEKGEWLVSSDWVAIHP